MDAKSALFKQFFHGTKVENAISILSGGPRGFRQAVSGDNMKAVCLANHPAPSYFKGAMFECAVKVFQANWQPACKYWPHVPEGLGIFKKKGTPKGQLMCHPSDVVAHSLWLAPDELESVLRRWEQNPRKMFYGGGACYSASSTPLGRIKPRNMKPEKKKPEQNRNPE